MINASTISRIDDLEVAGKRVLVRIDVDGAVERGHVVDDRSIRALLPTVEHLVDKNARVILMSHLGRPGGKVDPSLGMEPVGIRLAELLEGGEVILTDACVGDGARRVALDLRDGQVALLENLSFHAGEEANDDKFARELASLGEVYIQEAFTVLHRIYASTIRVPRLVEKRACGLQMEREITALERLMKRPERPYVAVLGGASLADAVDLLLSLLDKADTVLFGGAIANTLIAARHGPLGKTAVEEPLFPLARDIMGRAKAGSSRLVFPTDVVVADPADVSFEITAAIDGVPADMAVFDIGADTRAHYKEVISRAGTVVWIGDMGTLDRAPFQMGTLTVARAIAGSAAFSLTAGNEARDAVSAFGLEKGFDHISYGGDATIRLLGGKVLPGIESLTKK